MDLLWMLANLTGLVAGERQTKQQKVRTQKKCSSESLVLP